MLMIVQSLTAPTLAKRFVRAPIVGEMAIAQADTRDSPSGFTERTAWARNLGAPLRDYLSTEAGGAIVLVAATLVALVWANGPWSDSYESLWTTGLSIRIGDSGISQDLREWVNNGLMTFFFVVAGLEARRELDVGQLRDRRRLPILAAAAVGGMAFAVAVYLLINLGGPGAHGWGVAMSTDTAFALGVLALVAPGATRLRVRLLSVLVFDDLVALAVIAIVYTSHVSVAALAVAVALVAALYAVRYLPAEWQTEAIVVLGVALWVALYESGIDPVVTGLAVGLTTSAYLPDRRRLEAATNLVRAFREQPTPERARAARLGMSAAISPNERLQYALHPWSSFLIVPVFALANAGIHIDSGLISDAATSPITWGIVAGYLVGKPLGLSALTALGFRLSSGVRRQLSWPLIAGNSVVGAIGFTVSILIATIAFDGAELEEAKLGILATAILASLGSWAVFAYIKRRPEARRVAPDDLVDLSDDVDPKRDHVRGGEDAAVTLVEYGDYECPYCGQAEVVVRELLSDFGDDLRYVWRNLPLNDVHPNTQLAAEAAEAAATQGAFWPMHDLLLQHQDELSPSDLGRYATEIGLDLERFWDELDRHEHVGRVAEDVATADASGVAGTPSFFINGKRHHGAYDVRSLAKAVRAARAAATEPVGAHG
jgi:Na+/H+ antiporter NhaA